MKRTLRIIAAAMRANAVPAAILWTAAVAMAAGYGLVPEISRALEPVARWQAENGWKAAFATQFVFCGAVPCAFMLLVRSIRTRHVFAKALAQAVWCGAMGAACWWFYGIQCRIFGGGGDISTVVRKTFADQFVWTPFVVSPLGSLFFVWLGCDFSASRTLEAVRGGFVRRVVMPNLVANWCVWIPAVAAIYTFPRALQIVVQGIFSSLWTLLCARIGAISSRSEERSR